MRIKENPMKNGQLKAGYNVQIATNNQFVVGYQRLTDTWTVIPFLKRLDYQHALEHYIVADAGYGSEQNEDKLPDHIPLIPYGTMLKRNGRKWQSDDRKVMNWTTMKTMTTTLVHTACGSTSKPIENVPI